MQPVSASSPSPPPSLCCQAGEVTKNLTDIARRAREVASDAAAYMLGAPMEAARTATAVMHLLGFATAYGACVWVTFVSSHVLASTLPRQQLGVVQSKLYPVYFRVMAYCIGLALATHVLGRERGSFAARAQSFNLLSALGLVLANMLLLEPKATKEDRTNRGSCGGAHRAHDANGRTALAAPAAPLLPRPRRTRPG